MRSTPALAALVVFTIASGDSLAQITEWRPDLIAKYESEGGQNLPNNLFDGPYGRRSAGGVCQMLTRNWLRVAPMIDIDVAKFPVAGTATEFDQWRACWKLWTLDGYSAWTCCNAKLRQVLGHPATNPSAAAARGRSTAEMWRPVPVKGNSSKPLVSEVDTFTARFAASSDIYSAPARSEPLAPVGGLRIFQ